MVFENHEEFWKALGRLYDDVLETKESVKQLNEAAGRLASAVQKDHEIIMVHERRLDRAEITIEAILEDLRHHREGSSS